MMLITKGEGNARQDFHIDPLKQTTADPKNLYPRRGNVVLPFLRCAPTCPQIRTEKGRR
jgi:hypothetical protein